VVTTIGVTGFAAVFGNGFLVANVPNIYFWARCSHIINQEDGYPRMTDLLRHIYMLCQFGLGVVYSAFALNHFVPVDFYHCWCLLPHFQSQGILDPPNKEYAGFTEAIPHIMCACCLFLGSALTYLLDRHAQSLGHAPTRRMFVALYITLFQLSLSFFISFAAIQCVNGYSAPWTSKFKAKKWLAPPLLMMLTCIAQIRYLFRAGNPRSYNAAAERSSWHLDKGHFPGDPPKATISWPAKHEIFDYGYSTPRYYYTLAHTLSRTRGHYTRSYTLSLSYTRSYTLSYTRSYTHSLSRTLSHTLSFVHSLIHFLIHFLIHSLFHSLIYSVTQWVHRARYIRYAHQRWYARQKRRQPRQR
jgi:hypothetical protein